MTHELYINDILVELDKDVNIYLLYQSMLFTDLKNIVSNRSYNVNLPKTAVNLRAIGHCHLADIKDEPTGFPRVKHRVRYIRNGVEIIRSGQGTLLGIDKDRINFAFAWGNVENFQKLFDKNLNELTNLFEYKVPWSDNAPYVQDINAPYGLYKIDFGRGLDNKRYQHPCVSTHWLIPKIGEDNGIQIPPFGENCLIPLPRAQNHTPSDKIFKTTQTDLRLIHSNGSPGLELCIYPTADYDDPMRIYKDYYYNLEGMHQININIPSFSIVVLGTGKYRPRYDLRIGHTVIIEEKCVTVTKVSDGYKYTYPAVNQPVTIKGGRHKLIAMSSPRLFLSQYADALFEFSITPYYTAAKYGDAFSVLNFPEMKQADFLKNLMQMYGMFAYVKAENSIGFLSVDDMVANKSNARNWTDKLMSQSQPANCPAQIEFTLNGFAQENKCMYDNDDEIESKNDASGLLRVDNQTIEKEKELIELEFSQTNNVTVNEKEYAKIQMYEGDGSVNDINPRILKPKLYDNVVAGVFEQLSWNELLYNHYYSYQNVIRTPRVLKVDCLLNDWDLAELDLTVPVYFEQFGQYYAIMKVQAAADGKCKCEFLEI